MKTLSFYEQCGILIPGAVLLFGILFFIPDLRALFSSTGITVGGLGLFLLLAYAIGHAVAAVGNLLEWVYWRIAGGMPTDWIATKESWLLRDDQIEALGRQIGSRLGIDITKIRGLTKEEWKPIFGQLYRDVLVNNPGRIETFNGNYGLNRGLAAAVLCLIPIVAVISPVDETALIVAAIIVASIFMYRMQRFGVHFGREVYYNFLNLPATRFAEVKKNA